MKKINIIFLAIISIGLLAGLGFWWWQGNSFSKDILQLEILGPNQAAAGDVAEYLVKIKNNDNGRLEEVELSFEYPENVMPLEDSQQRTVQALDDLYPGEERVISFKGLLLGKENDVLEFKALVNFKPKNLKTAYDRETTFITKLKLTPLTFEFDLPSKIEASSPINFSLNYFSNAGSLLENLRVKIQYPNGFTFVSASPKALDKTEWLISSLGKAQGGRIEISGLLEGEESSSKIFQAQLGIIKDDVFITLKQISQTVEIGEPSLYISQMINGSVNYNAREDELLHYEVFFKNLGKNPIQKKFMFAKLDSPFFDLSSLRSETGDVGRGDNSVLWDWKNVSDLRFLDSGDEGKVDFWIRTKPKESITSKAGSPLLRNDITLGASQKTFQVKISSAINLDQKVFYQEEFFGNSGPLPPQAGQPTTYTVVWQIKNYWNDLSNAKVKATLPDNVSVTGNFFPEDSKFTYDSVSKEVIWNIGPLPAWQGFGQPDALPLTLAFQISFNPSNSQKGKVALLVNQAEAGAEDSFSGEIVQETVNSLTTADLSDPAGATGGGIVQ